MTSDTRLAQAAGLPVVGHDGSHQLAAGIAPPPHVPPATGFKKIHRLLRGRYPLVIGLGLALGITLGLIGFFSKRPMYESHCRIYVSPTIPSAHAISDTPVPGFNTFLQSQAAVIESRDMVELALKNPKWLAQGGGKDDASVDAFYSNLDVEEIPNTSILQISYSDPDPVTAKIGADVMGEAYQDFYESEDPLLLTHKINQLDTTRSRIGNDLELLRASFPICPRNTAPTIWAISPVRKCSSSPISTPN